MNATKQQSPAKPTSSKVNAETVRIIKSLGYGAEELHANRNGMITQKQRANFHTDILTSGIIYGILLTVFVGLLVLGFTGQLDSVMEEVFLFNSLSNSRRQRNLTFAVIALVFGAFYSAYVLFSVLVRIFALQQCVVVRYFGPVRKEYIRDKDKEYYHLQFDGLKRQIPPDLFHLFKNGKHYVIYYLKDYPSLLSVEAVDSIFNSPVD